MIVDKITLKYLNLFFFYNFFLNNGFHYPHVWLAGKLGEEEGSK
jgi:hypothetical protein